MPELDDLPPPPQQGAADPLRIQRGVLDEQVELWWFVQPGRSLLCYSVSVLLVLGCGLGGVGLLSTTTSASSEWRLGAGSALCLLALAVLLKQLLSSAVQDMNCVRSRQRIDVLRSGGLSDVLLVFATGAALIVCGAVLLDVALANHMPKPGRALNDMYVSGVVLLAVGGAAVSGAGLYAGAVFLLDGTGAGRMRRRRRGGGAIGVFTVSGQLDRRARRETASSLANLI